MKRFLLAALLMFYPLMPFADQNITGEPLRLKQAMQSAMDKLGAQITYCNRKNEQNPVVTLEDLKPFDRQTATTAMIYFKNNALKSCLKQQEYEYMMSMIAYAGSFPESAHNEQKYQTVIESLIVFSPSANPSVVEAEGKFLALPESLREKLKDKFESKSVDLELVLNYYDSLSHADKKP